MGQTVDAKHPDVLLVVLDCVRASDFPGSPEYVGHMPWTERLLSESTCYRKAVSVAPWTIPAHASIFTGLYPWIHGCHARGSLVLRSELPRLPSALQRGGYATFSLSANPFVNSSFGLTDGFEKAAWGGWWEAYARLPRDQPPSGSDSKRSASATFLQKARESGLASFLMERMDDAYRYPFALDLMNRMLQSVRAPEATGKTGPSPWIESTFQRWISSVDHRQPVFSFINLVDAHEPYYADSVASSSIRQWLRYAASRQDHLSFAAGQWTLRPDVAELLHRLYRSAIDSIDSRLRRLAEILESAGRWDSTQLILTSDHGQAFGEHGVLFHMFRPDESELRIPLIVRDPSSLRQRSASGWASLVDIAPTVLQSAGLPNLPLASGVPLSTLMDSDRAGPTLAMSDGLIFSHVRSRMDSARRTTLDRTHGVAYQGNRKVVVDPTSASTKEFDVLLDPSESQDLWRGGMDTPLARAASQVAQDMGATLRIEPSAEIADRLKSWGY